ncbi:MAG: peptidoglycan DD-metalloendopeptidase family protein [Bacteroidota bacterium]|nr:peptidoglycan DD-metalloendopeptidase family protein [Bacteroidota bacterium]
MDHNFLDEMKLFSGKIRIILFILIVFLSLPLLLCAQKSKEELKASKEKLEKDIQFTNKLLSETKKSKSSSLNQLVILENKISQREELIATITNETALLDEKIEKNNQKRRQLKKELEHLKEEYARMIYFAFKNRSVYNRMVFVFSSKDFNQAYRRLKYFQQYGAYRQTQAELIIQTQQELENTILELEDQKEDKIVLMKEKESEIQKLKTEQEQKNQTVSELNRKERKLTAELREKEEEAKKLQAAIEEIIAEEMRAAAERAKTEKANKGLALSPEELALSGNFSGNKGKLPWPSDKGIISSTFGEHQHPVLKRVKIKNNGINILTSKGGVARSVFNGTVISVRYITNTNIAVIIKHGEYFSVYSNLDKVYVQRGDAVKTGQEIGVIYTHPADNKTELHFEIWKGKTLLNPSYWILSGKS